MKQINKSSALQIMVIFTFLHTIAITPFWNKDGMIIPKLIIMFTLAMYLFPILVVNRHLILSSKITKFVVIIQCVLLVQNLIVLITSSAPLEQQIFGRTGRGLGLITTFSLAIILLATMLFVEVNQKNHILLGLIISGFISSLYSVLQSFGIDILKWESRTNGVIGTLGNPNFQSAFAAIVIVPSILYFSKSRKQYLLALLSFMFFSFTIYRTQSTQGIIAGFFSIAIALIIFSWYKNKLLFGFMLLSGFVSSIFAILGMLNMGPLSGYLYKVSVQSRGDFWRAAFNTANDNPIFGVGLDSFGDYSLKYRDEIAVNHSFAEYTDNAHNFFLENAATGGYPSAILNLLIVIFVLFAFVLIQRDIKKFDATIVSLFSAWAAFQMTTVISPGNLVTMHWNAIISGAIIGIAKFVSPDQVSMSKVSVNKINNLSLVSLISSITALVIVFPVFNVDRMQLTGMQTGDANLVIRATTSYPEATVRYSLIGKELLDSGLTQQSLELARSGVEFNPHSAGLWALILVNPNAQKIERLEAKKRILELDPLNTEVQNFIP
jgi:O-antigen ligase